MMASLQTHFLGTAQVEHIVQYARTNRDNATFQSQAIYYFGHFSTNLQEAFTLLAEYDVTIPEAEQIRLLREKIKTNKADFDAAIVTSLMDGTLLTYADVVAHVSQYVSHFFPASTMPRPRGKATVSGVSLLQVAHETHGDKYYYNSVDITDFTRRYTKDEWMKIKNVWSKIQAEKDRKKSPSSSKPSKSYKQQNKSLKQQVESLFKRVSSQQQALLLPPQRGDQPPANDDEDEPTRPFPYEKRQKTASPVHIHQQYHVNLTSTINIQPDSVQHDSKAVYHSSYFDEDSHADMHCAGSNFTLLKYSGYKCDVDLFLVSYTTTTGVPVVTATTAVHILFQQKGLLVTPWDCLLRMWGSQGK